MTTSALCGVLMEVWLDRVLPSFPLFPTNQGGYVPSDGQFLLYRFTIAAPQWCHNGLITRKRYVGACSHNAFDGDPFCTSHPTAPSRIFVFLIVRFISPSCPPDSRRRQSSPSTYTSGHEVKALKCFTQIFLIARVRTSLICVSREHSFSTAPCPVHEMDRWHHHQAVWPSGGLRRRHFVQSDVLFQPPR